MLLCLLTLTVSLCIFTACDKDETPGKSAGSTEGGTTGGGASGGETNGGSTNGGTTDGENDGEEGGGQQANEKYTVTFKADGVTVGTVEFNVGDTSITAPSVPLKQCYSGAWESYTLGTENITVNAVYTVSHSALTKAQAVDAKCNATGNIEYWSCSGCDKYFSDADGRTEITDKESVILQTVNCSYIGTNCKWCGEKKPSEGLVFTLSGDKTYYTVSGIDTCTDTDIVIPNEYEGKPVKAIGIDAFEHCEGIKTVIIPDSVIEIHHSAFSYCTNLTSVVVGNSVEMIGYSAFGNCTSLTEINIPDSVTLISGFAFQDCTALESIVIGNKVETIDGSAFYDCENLKSVIISDSVKTIGEKAFYGCEELKNITIGKNVESIGKDAFSVYLRGSDVYYRGDIEKWCNINFGNSFSNPMRYESKFYINGEHVTNIVIPYTVTKIGTSTFAYFTDLNSIVIGGNIESIGDYAFSNCLALRGIILSDKVKTVGSYAFTGCELLQSITIGDGLASLSDNVFNYCSKLATINVSSENLTYSSIDGVLYSKDGKTLLMYPRGKANTEFTVPDEVTVIGEYAFKECGALESVTLGNNVNTIGKNAFYWCSGLKSITVPVSVTKIGSTAFFLCSKLESIIYDGTEAQWEGITKESGWDSGSGSYTVVCSDSDKCSTLTHHARVEAKCNETGNIEYWSCADCGKYFSDANGNNEITDKASVILQTVDCSYISCVCEWCGGEKHDLIYYGIAESSCTETGIIGHWECEGCYKYFMDSEGIAETYDIVLPSVGCAYTNGVCKWCGVGEGSVGLEYRLDDYGRYYYVVSLGTCTDTDIVIPTTYNGKPVNEVVYGAFRNKKNITSVVIGNNVQKIGDYAFEYCRGLVSVTLGSKVSSIGTSAFDHCNKLVEVINKSKKGITKGSRENGLVGNFAMVIHDGKTMIVNKDGYLFITNEGINYLLGYVENVTRLTLPTDYNGEKYVIYRYVFAERADITKITLGTGVAGINYRAFWRCTGLTTIDFRGTVSQWETVVKEDKWAQEAGSYTVVCTGCVGGCENLTHCERTEAQCNATGNIEYWICDECGKYFSDANGTSEITNKQSVVIQRVDCFYVNDVCKWCGIGRASEGLKYTLSADGSGYSVAGIGTCTDSDVVIPAMYNGLPVKYIAENAFHSCNQLITVTVGKNVVGISDYVFSASKNLTTVIIYECVTNISSTAFSGCGALTNIIVSSENEKFKSIDGNLYSKDGKTLIKYAIGKRNTTFTVPEEVITIGDYAFEGCKPLTNIVLGNNVKNIRVAALSFTGITSITIPSSVTTIGYGGLIGCTDLIVINYRGTEEQWNAISKGTHWDEYYDSGTYKKLNYTVTYNYTVE